MRTELARIRSITDMTDEQILERMRLGIRDTPADRFRRQAARLVWWREALTFWPTALTWLGAVTVIVFILEILEPGLIRSWGWR